MSPPLLQPLLVSPIRVSRGMTADARCKAVLKTKISPMLLASTTYPLPAHRPWSAGSMSIPNTLVLCSPLSTAFKPFTPVAPPEDKLMMSQPGPNGWQLTVGGLTAEALRGRRERRVRPGDGKTFGLDKIPNSVSGLVTAAPLEARDAVDGEKKGPVSKEQP
jgi:hypothetical protein